MAKYQIYDYLNDRWEYADPRVAYNIMYHHTVEWTTTNEYFMDECVLLFKDGVPVDVLYVGDIKLNNVVKTVIARSPLNDSKQLKFHMNVPPDFVGDVSGNDALYAMLCETFYYQRSPVDGATFTLDTSNAAQKSLTMNDGKFNTSSRFAGRYPQNTDPTPFPPDFNNGEGYTDGWLDFGQQTGSRDGETQWSWTDWASVGSGWYNAVDDYTNYGAHVATLTSTNQHIMGSYKAVSVESQAFGGGFITNTTEGLARLETFPAEPPIEFPDTWTPTPYASTETYVEGFADIWQYSSMYEANSLYKKFASYGEYLVVDYIDWSIPFNTINYKRPVPCIHYKIARTTNHMGDLDVVSYQIAPNTSPIVGASIKQQLRALIRGSVTARDTFVQPEAFNLIQDNINRWETGNTNTVTNQVQLEIPYGGLQTQFEAYGNYQYITQVGNDPAQPLAWTFDSVENTREYNTRRDITYSWGGTVWRRNYYLSENISYGAGGSIYTLYPSWYKGSVQSGADVSWAMTPDYDYDPYAQGLSDAYRINADQISYGKMITHMADDNEIYNAFAGSDNAMTDVIDGHPAPANIQNTFWYLLNTSQTDAVFMLDHSDVDYVGNFVTIKGVTYEITEQYGNLLASSDYTINHFK